MAKDKSGPTGPKSGKKGSDKPAKKDAPARLEDDASLWARVAETTEPLAKRNRFVDAVAPRAPVRQKPKPTAKSGAASSTPLTPSAPKQSPKTTVKKAPAPTSGLDRQTARKLDKGSLAIEARIDLHGMRQREAHGALRKFLYWARGKDYRHVLVITGKGSVRDEAKSYYEEDVRGVLRQQVPHWLSHGDLAPMIVSFSEAPLRLGGSGALYVRLRRSSRSR